jgi:hypothetical protein
MKQTQIQKILHKITYNLAIKVNIKYANGFTKCIVVIIEGGIKKVPITHQLEFKYLNDVCSHSHLSIVFTMLMAFFSEDLTLNPHFFLGISITRVE